MRNFETPVGPLVATIAIRALSKAREQVEGEAEEPREPDGHADEHGADEASGRLSVVEGLIPFGHSGCHALSAGTERLPAGPIGADPAGFTDALGVGP
jgi:hypothetical protein